MATASAAPAPEPPQTAAKAGSFWSAAVLPPL